MAGALLIALYVFFRSRDKRMLRNGVVLVAAVFCLLVGLLDITWAHIPAQDWLIAKGVLLTLAGIVLLALFLMVNGVTMFFREGRRLGNLLSLVAGLLVLGSPLAVINLLNVNTAWSVPLAVLIFFGFGYLGVVFLIFLTYALVYGHTKHQQAPAAVVVLGSRLINGRVPPLLRARLNKAVEVYRAADPKPLLIPSGGQGPDESRPEGEAMAEYLAEHGIPEEDIAAENQAVNTEQNLRYSQQVQQEVGRAGPVLVATNNYHVLRAALLARRLKLDAEVVGARTAGYYMPSAFLREFIAVMKGHLFLHIVLFAPFIALAVYFFILYMER